MAHRDVEIVKELQAKVADLVKKLDGPRFRSTADEQRIIDFANCNVGKSEKDSLVEEVYFSVLKQFVAKRITDAIDEYEEVYRNLCVHKNVEGT